MYADMFWKNSATRFPYWHGIVKKNKKKPEIVLVLSCMTWRVFAGVLWVICVTRKRSYHCRNVSVSLALLSALLQILYLSYFIMYHNMFYKKYKLLYKIKNGVARHWHGAPDTDIACYQVNSRWSDERGKDYICKPDRCPNIRNTDGKKNCRMQIHRAFQKMVD